MHPMEEAKGFAMEVLHVKVTNPEDIRPPKVVTIEHEPEHFSLATYVVGPGFIDILQEDPLRKDALIIASDAPIVICHSNSQANSPRNQAAGLPNPDGFYAATGVGVQLNGTAKLWVACPLTTRVSVAITRRG